MTTIIVDGGMRTKLLAAGRAVGFRDEADNLIGRYVSAEPTEADDSDHGLSPEELQRRLAPDCKTYTTEEVLAHLRGLK